MGKRLLFVCIGNACRSIMAEALMRHYWGHLYTSGSAGIRPLGRVPEDTTLAVLKEIGVSTQGLYSKGLRDLDLGGFPFIINLCEYSLEGIIPNGYKGKVINWYVRDPYGESLDSFRKARDTIEWLVMEKIPEWVQD